MTHLLIKGINCKISKSTLFQGRWNILNLALVYKCIWMKNIKYLVDWTQFFWIMGNYLPSRVLLLDYMTYPGTVSNKFSVSFLFCNISLVLYYINYWFVFIICYHHLSIHVCTWKTFSIKHEIPLSIPWPWTQYYRPTCTLEMHCFFLLSFYKINLMSGILKCDDKVFLIKLIVSIQSK